MRDPNGTDCEGTKCGCPGCGAPQLGEEKVGNGKAKWTALSTTLSWSDGDRVCLFANDETYRSN